ncbi:mechanosensitive ion channel, partial [Candidatus Gracilibacteria bacterium]|nr:mechanosensitive ion channel [Candidatus Gracilibacteria bacterium]
MWDMLNSVDLGSLMTTLQPGVMAIIILIVGYLAAKLISSLVKKGLGKAKFITKILSSIGVDVKGKTLSGVVSKIIFVVIMLFVVVQALGQLGLDEIKEPIQAFINHGLMDVLKALGLAAIAWLIATFSKLLVIKGGKAANLDKKLGEDVATETSITETLGNVLYWFIILFFIPSILGALGQQELLEPITNIINDITGYIPNIIAAGVIFVIGWFIAKTLRKITTGLLSSMGADKASEKIGLKDFAVSKLAGTVVYVIVLVPILIQALDKLAIETISGPAKQMLNTMMSALPGIFAAVVIIGISYAIGKFISKLVSELLSGMGFDKVLGLVGLNSKSKTSPSSMVGTLVFVYILLLAVIEAANQIGFGGISEIVNQFMGFATNVLVGVVIFGIGMFLANLAANAIKTTSDSKILPKIAKGAIIILTAFMGLQQMGLG